MQDNQICPPFPTCLTKLPSARFLSLMEIRIYASEIASHFKETPPNTIIKIKSKYFYKTEFYSVTITSSLYSSIIHRSQCKYFWRRELEKRSNQDRLDHEAKNGIVGKTDLANSLEPAQLYCSDPTLQRAREKSANNERSLASCYLHNTLTGEKTNLLDIVKSKEENRVAELYNLCKSLERLADAQSFQWLFITLTAPPKYHPNPTVGKKPRNRKIKIKDSHEYINSNWRKIRAILNSRGIPASPETYFGFRVVEPHQDGCIHWHLIIFSSPEKINEIKKAIREKFPTEASADIMLGKTGPGMAKAASYIFKYLTKGFSKKNEAVQETPNSKDLEREAKDLASMRNKERVQAAIRALNIRQFQVFGVKNLLTTFRRINALKLNDISPETGSVLEYVKNEIWRNPNGYFVMLSNSELFGSESKIKLIMESSKNSYGETIKKCKGIKIGNREFLNDSPFKIERIQPSTEGRKNTNYSYT